MPIDAVVRMLQKESILEVFKLLTNFQYLYLPKPKKYSAIV